MGPIHKYEAAGIFLSVAVMAVALAFVRFSDAGILTALSETSNEQRATVVAANSADSSALADTLYDSATPHGELENLVIDDVRIGTGPSVVEGDTVTVHYIGTTQSGVKFDSSYDRGEPFTFTIGGGRVIEGWEQGVVGMQTGGQRILVIPPEMAYGNRQVGPIPPNSILVFAVELLDIK